MDIWESVKDLKSGDEACVAVKDGYVHGVVFEKDDAKKTITFVNKSGKKVPVVFGDEKAAAK